MKVKDLINYLEGYDPNMEVVMSSDAEGNIISPLADLDTAMYEAENTWSGSIYSKEDYEEYARGNGEEVVCLWPTN